MSDLRDEQAAAMAPLRAPSGRQVIDRVTAERLAPPRLRAADAGPADQAAEVERLSGLLAAAESRVLEERAGRKKAEAAANEMAVLVARVRNELSEERSARSQAESSANEIAGLIAAATERARQAEDQLRIAWAQVPMVEQSELAGAGGARLGARLKRGVKKR